MRRREFIVCKEMIQCLLIEFSLQGAHRHRQCFSDNGERALTRGKEAANHVLDNDFHLLRRQFGETPIDDVFDLGDEAAAAATKADRVLRHVVSRDPSADPEEQSPYRDDLAKVVRPHSTSRPISRMVSRTETRSPVHQSMREM